MKRQQPRFTMHARTGGSTHGHPRIHYAHPGAPRTICGLELDSGDRWTTRSRRDAYSKTCGDCERRASVTP